MAAIKEMSRIKDKWTRASAAATQDYTDGINLTTKDWAKNTAAAEASYNAGVQAAISRKAFSKAVTKAGHDTWKKAAVAKGASRWAMGISESQANYEAGFQPYRDVIANLTLPARGPKGDPANIQRVTVVAKALHDAKLART